MQNLCTVLALVSLLAVLPFSSSSHIVNPSNTHAYTFLYICHSLNIQQAWNTLCKGPGTSSVNVWGHRPIVRQNNRANNEKKPIFRQRTYDINLRNAHGEYCTDLAKPLHCSGTFLHMPSSQHPSDLYTPFNNANPCRGVDSCFINIYGKVLSKRRANCQHNQPVLVQQAHNLQRHLSKCHSNHLDVESNWLVYLTSFNNWRQANLYFTVILLCLCITLSCNFLTNTGDDERTGSLYRGKFWPRRFLLLPVQCKLHSLCVCNVCV